MAKTALALRKDGYDIAQPPQVVAMADVLKKHVVHQQLYTAIQGKNYAHVEGWQFAGGLMGMFPRVEKVEDRSTDKETKWFAEVAVVRMSTGEVVSRGFAVCSSLEGKGTKRSKANNDEYAILSMAQTRAIGKAYRNVIGYIMKLAGYQGTPAEEMGAMGETKETPAEPVIQTEVHDYHCVGIGKGGCGEDLTAAEADYSKKRYGKHLCRMHQKEAKPIKK